MSLSLPVDPPSRRNLTGVVTESIAALSDESSWLAPATSAIVCVIDGLGARNLAERSGHARFLSARRGRKDVAGTVFPATTAAALTSLLTGVPPGVHGVVGYRVRVPETGKLVNQLHGQDQGLLDNNWQRKESLMAAQARQGRPCFAVSKPEYTGTGFTRSTLGGATLISHKDLSERVAIAADLAASHPGALVYLYTPELDKAGHKFGCMSEEWASELDEVDGGMALLERKLAPGTGVVITADHGMVDVPAHRRQLIGEGNALWDGVSDVGGEPRMLHLYTEEGRTEDVYAAWQDAEASRAWVIRRADAIEAGLFGPVAAEVRERIGDVIIAARASIAYYDDRVKNKAPQSMVGQHGSLTDAERTIPLIRLGAYA